MTKPRASKQEPELQPDAGQRPRRPRLFIVVVVLAVLGIFAALNLTSVMHFPLPGDENRWVSHSITDPDAPLASFYSPEVMHWQPQILRWAREHDVNPNVIAIVIQIESCGDPSALSGAGAVGLMQVMPYHFDNGDNMLNPDVNVQHGMSVFNECLFQFAGQDLGEALACYNGGPSVTQSDISTWAVETQYYYHWATGLWGDVVSGNKKSSTLTEWLSAGGERLCKSAASTLFLPR